MFKGGSIHKPYWLPLAPLPLYLYFNFMYRFNLAKMIINNKQKPICRLEMDFSIETHAILTFPNAGCCGGEVVKWREWHLRGTSSNHIWDLFFFIRLDIIKVMYFFFWHSSKVLQFKKILSRIGIKT